MITIIAVISAAALIGAGAAVVCRLCWDLDVHEPEDENRGER